MLYAAFVYLILSAIYSFSLSNIFEFTKIKLKTIITKNIATKYPGIIAKFLRTFAELFFLNAFIALIEAKTITNENIKYPHL